MGLFSRKKAEGGEIGSVLKKKYKARHAFDKFKMKEAFNILDECAASLLKQGVETRILDDYIVDVDVDFQGNVITVSYDEGREFFRKGEDGNYTKIEPGG